MFEWNEQKDEGNDEDFGVAEYDFGARPQSARAAALQARLRAEAKARMAKSAPGLNREEMKEKINMTVAVEVSPATAAKLQAIADALHLSVDEYLGKVTEIVPLPAATGQGATEQAKPAGGDFDDEETKLVEAGLMRLPTAELTEDFWQMPAPQVSTAAIIAAIQADRDER